MKRFTRTSRLPVALTTTCLALLIVGAALLTAAPASGLAPLRDTSHNVLQLIPMGRGSNRNVVQLIPLKGANRNVVQLIPMGRGASRDILQLILLGRGASHNVVQLIPLGRGSSR